MLKHKENEAAAKKQLVTMHGTASFTSSTNITPDRSGSGKAKNESPELNAASSIISAGGEAPDPKIGGGLQVVAEEKSDGAGDVSGEHDLNFSQENNQEPLRLSQNDEPQDVLRSNSNELGNLESDFQSGTDGVDDLAGDIINPMEDAEYYQGSFGDDNLLPEYKSQGSDEEGEEAESKDVEV